MQKKLSALMLVGTGSDVGKSILCAGLCRIFKQDGYAPAPFKAQNMSLNSYPTPDGLEIGRAQAVQAEACGLAPRVEMNPVLLKPTTHMSSQVVLLGKPLGNQSAQEYFQNNRLGLFQEATRAYDTLAAQYSPMVLEGAGSISELNLRDRDIVNLRMAAHANAATILVGDIDRGGVIASLYGSMQLLGPAERALIKGIIVNKFRGDVTLFRDGVRAIEELCGVPVLGVVPYLDNLDIDDEDSVVLAGKRAHAAEGRVNVAVVLLNKMSNFTDFNTLERDPRVHLYYTRDPSEIAHAQIVIVPGSKNTIADLLELRHNGCAAAIVQAARAGRTVVGVCGGYQMLGESISDPHRLEGDVECLPGLGLLPVHTVMMPAKTTVQRNFYFSGSSEKCVGYEIHMGVSTWEHAKPLNVLEDGSGEGYRISHRCWGTYLHGIFDNAPVVDSLLAPYTTEAGSSLSAMQRKEQAYDSLAAHLRTHLDISRIYSLLQ
jgi:adenosylcobyric acid synthase